MSSNDDFDQGDVDDDNVESPRPMREMPAPREGSHKKPSKKSSSNSSSSSGSVPLRESSQNNGSGDLFVNKTESGDYLSSDFDETSDEEYAQQEQYRKDDPALNFLYQPHTISLLLCLLFLGLYLALFEVDSEAFEVRVKWGLTALVIVFVLMGTVLLRNGPFSRPHPTFWRAVLAISITYELFLVFLFFLSVDDARQLFKHVNPSLGVPLPERSYAEHCEFTLENFIGGFDEFVLAHILGWWAKTLILRDVWLAWILSVMFEIMEYSLEHHLENFKECFWDHWILDVLICNWLGIFLGMKSLQFLETKTYDWRGWNKITTRTGKAKRAFEQFTPESWTVFEWGATKTFKRWLCVIFVLFVFLQTELNAFYLKYILWFPPTEPLNTYRLSLHFFAGLVGVREAYRYLVDSKCKRLGSQAWMCIAMIQTETLLCIKWGKNLFPKPTPPHVGWFWTIFLSLLFLFTLLRFTPLNKYFFKENSLASILSRKRLKKSAPQKEKL